MKILLSNDDGYNAKGIQSLVKVLSKNHDVYMVAPHIGRSGCGHGLSFMDSLEVNLFSENQYHCSGSPADCILIGVKELFKDIDFDLVISGINKGANLGLDTYYSGTAAAAREATLRGIPAIAISLCCDFPESGEDIYYDEASAYLDLIISRGAKDLIQKDTFLNINVPNCELKNVSSASLSKMGRREFFVAFKTDDNKQYRYDSYMSNYLELKDSDCVHLADNKISVSPINVFSGYSDIGIVDCFDQVFGV